ncbi:DUF4358 domain-containing protein [Dysosmobacter sp.]
MKKRLLALLLTLALALPLTACGGTDEPEKNDAQQMEDPVPPEEGALEGTGETGSADGAEEETGEPEEAGKPGDGGAPAAPAEKPAQQTPPAPVQKPAQTPAAKPGASETESGVDLTAFYTALESSVENWPAMMSAEGETLDAFYAGLSDLKTRQCSVHMAMISAAVGEIALVEVEDAGDVQKVKDIFQARIDSQVGDDQNPGGAWYPESIEGWKNNSRIVSNGTFVMLVALEGADSIVEQFNALFA